jgi:hypothetical protein
LSWKIRYHEEKPYPARPGDCYPAPWLLTSGEDGGPAEGLSPKYLRDWRGKRPPLVVILPDMTRFVVDSLAVQGGRYYGDGWTVTGEPPLLTVQPSINIPGSYHGYVTAGVISDDVEGRKFEPFEDVSDGM